MKDLFIDKDIFIQMYVFEILEYVILNKFYNKVKGLFKFLFQYGGDVFFWKDNGNLIYKDNVIEGLYIIDLIKYVLIYNLRGIFIGY